jgi:hypothetical protein
MYIINEQIRTLLNKSTWSTRVWTLQELVFSTHVLVFTEKEVSFPCLRGQVCESRLVPKNRGFDTEDRRGGERLCNYILGAPLRRMWIHPMGLKRPQQLSILLDCSTRHVTRI